MLRKLTMKAFKSVEDVAVELGLVNVFIGANGSGKSNLLEGLGVLSAAANGMVDTDALLARGVRPGTPSLYKTAFPPRRGRRALPHLYFSAESAEARYEVTLHNPLKSPEPAWRYKTELWMDGADKLLGRSVRQRGYNPKRGLAALKSAEVEGGPGLSLLETLQGYVIYSPATAVLRGVEAERREKIPLGLAGGNLAIALADFKRMSRDRNSLANCISRDIRGLIDWASAYSYSRLNRRTDSPAGASSAYTVRFRDRYMRDGRNVLSGQDVSEGALHVLFLGVLAAHPDSPTLCSVDNADQGLNPRLAKALVGRLCQWYVSANEAQVARQILLTTHNPLILDGLPLQDDRIRLFTVSRTTTGRTTIRRIEVDDELLARAADGWTLSRLWVMGHLGGVPDV